MPAYKAYPNKAKTPSRMSRKRDRATVFQHNRKITKRMRKERREARYAEIAE